MPDPICIWPGLAQKRAWWFLRTSLLPDWICLAKTWYSRPELTWILAVFLPIWPGLSVEEHRWVWKWETGSRLIAFCQNWAQWFTRTWQGRPDWIWASFAQYDQGLLRKSSTQWNVGSQIRRIESGPILSACGHNSHNWPQHNQNASELDPACLFDTPPPTPHPSASPPAPAHFCSNRWAYHSSTTTVYYKVLPHQSQISSMCVGKAGNQAISQAVGHENTRGLCGERQNWLDCLTRVRVGYHMNPWYSDSWNWLKGKTPACGIG